jgi:hypothetical protein
MKINRNTPDRFHATLTPEIVVGSIIFCAVVRLFSSSSLFADGAYHLMHNIAYKSPVMTGGREFSKWITQGLVVIALHFDLTSNTYYLGLLLGLGFQVLPAVLFGSAVWIIRKNQNAFVLTAPAGLLTFFFSGSIGESSLGAGLGYLAFSLMVRQLVEPKFGKLALLLVSIIAIRTYESLVLIIPVLIFMKLYKARRDLSRLWNPYDLSLLFCLLLGFGSTLRWSLFPDGGATNRNSMFNFSWVTNFPGFHYLVFLVIIVSLIATLSNSLLLLSFILIPFFCLLTANSLNLGLFYQTRGICVAILAFMMGIWVLLSDTKINLIYRYCTKFLVILSLAGVCTTITVNNNWSHFIGVIQGAQLTSKESYIKFEEIGLSETDKLESWGWTNPALSLLLRQKTESPVLSNPQTYDGVSPFASDSRKYQKYIWKK